MSNLMLDNANWKDYFNSSLPTDAWDGDAYTYNFSDGPVFDQMGLEYQIPASGGDTLSFDATFTDDPPPFDGDPFYLNVVNLTGNVLLQSFGPYTGASEPTIDYELSAGVLPAIYACSGPTDTGPALSYVGQIRLFPLQASIVAPDLFETMDENDPPIELTPAITSDGDPVTPDSLVIISPASNGVASVDGVSLVYEPDEDFFGNDSFTYQATVDGVDSNIATVSITVNQVVPPLDEPCQELGRTTRTYVSGYSLSRQNVCRVRRMAKRCVVANFNGALTKGRTIVSVRWETTSPWSLFMSNARIASNQRETMVDVIFNFAGWGGLLATATLDNGEVYNAEFSFTVLDAPLYPTADYPTSNGPYRLDVSA